MFELDKPELENVGSWLRNTMIYWCGAMVSKRREFSLFRFLRLSRTYCYYHLRNIWLLQIISKDWVSFIPHWNLMLTLWQITSEAITACLTNADDAVEKDSCSNPQDFTAFKKNPLECLRKDNMRMALTCLRLCLDAFTGFIALQGHRGETRYDPTRSLFSVIKKWRKTGIKHHLIIII